MNAEGLDEALEYYKTNYEFVFDQRFEGDTKIFLGRGNDRVCRFCSRNEDETKFGPNTHSHAVPAFLGLSLIHI